MRSFHLDDFASLTTLCRHCIKFNVHRIMTSWKKKLPHISVATCLRTEHSGSFNVLNDWLCGLCNCHLWVKKSLRKISEPIGSCLRLRVDVMEWLENDSFIIVTEHMEKWLQQLEISTLLTTLCGKIMSVTRVMESLPTLDKPSKRGWKMKLNHLDYIMRGKCDKSVCQMELPRNYETQPNREREVQESWIRA